MKAMAISQFSSNPVMHELPAPRPGEGEVLVNVEFASVNGMDVMTMAGMIEGMMPYELPITWAVTSPAPWPPLDTGSRASRRGTLCSA